MKEGNKMTKEQWLEANQQRFITQTFSIMDALYEAWDAGKQSAYEWQSPDNPPPSDGESRLVMLREGNSIGLTTKHPVMAEYGLTVNEPCDWTIFDGIDNKTITEDVISWTDLPKYTPS
jgi:hypothetical protein